MSKRLWGPLAALGLNLAVLAFGLDQLVKYWLLQHIGLAAVPTIAVTSFFDLHLTWNYGVSYGLLSGHNQLVLVVVSLVICAFLWFWLVKTTRPLTAAALGLIIGGALSNALDRALRGAVADFFYFHCDGLDFALLNFIFNLADVTIVAGVALLLYESFKEREARAKP